MYALGSEWAGLLAECLVLGLALPFLFHNVIAYEVLYPPEVLDSAASITQRATTQNSVNNYSQPTLCGDTWYGAAYTSYIYSMYPTYRILF